MNESILIAGEIYLMGFAISIVIAALIKGMLIMIRHISPKAAPEKQAAAKERVITGEGE
jgi:hypothetical protein